MQTVLLGQVVKKKYEAVRNCEERMINGELVEVFTGVPELKEEESVDEWREFCRYDGEPRYTQALNDMWKRFEGFYDKEFFWQGMRIKAKQENFHADLNEVHVETDHILDFIEEGKDIAESLHSTDMYLFNEEMIKSNESLKAYCDLHKLDYGSTDCRQLFKIVYPNKSWTIINGEMVDVEITVGISKIDCFESVLITNPITLSK